MAVKTVQYIIDGQTYNLTFDASTGEYKATVPAPSKSSYSQDGHKYGGLCNSYRRCRKLNYNKSK